MINLGGGGGSDFCDYWIYWSFDWWIAITHNKSFEQFWKIIANLGRLTKLYVCIFFRLSGKFGLPDNQRIIDPKKGPVKKTAVVRKLPKLLNNASVRNNKSSNGSR